jgi:hypothetical protein
MPAAACDAGLTYEPAAQLEHVKSIVVSGFEEGLQVLPSRETGYAWMCTNEFRAQSATQFHSADQLIQIVADLPPVFVKCAARACRAGSGDDLNAAAVLLRLRRLIAGCGFILEAASVTARRFCWRASAPLHAESSGCALRVSAG